MIPGRGLLWLCALLAGCASPASQANNAADAGKPGLKKAAGGGQKRGAYYLDDGPADFIAADIEALPDAEPRPEPLHRFANNPYTVFGVDYAPFRQPVEFKQRGIASWYGRRFHGQRTSSGEPYDMFGMSAAHPTLPIPSYARVTHLANGRSVVVRINDRGPFHSGRVIDLSFTAAWKLGYANAGSAMVEVESIPMESLMLASTAPASSLKTEPDPLDALIRSVTTPAPPSTELPAETESRGSFLQLAAFTSRENADSFRAHLSRELGSLAEKLVVHATEGRFRVRLGPYTNAGEARRVADRVLELLDIKPMVVTQ